jgi:hypothetical protein
VLYLADGYKKLCGARITPSYRRETAAAIIADVLDAADIQDRDITAPKVTIDRFAERAVDGADCLDLLIKALEEHGYSGLRYFFDSKDVFRFGTMDDSGKNDGPVYALESGGNIIRRGHGWVEILPLPIRHSQKVSINGLVKTAARTDLVVSGRASRLRVWGSA